MFQLSLLQAIEHSLTGGPYRSANQGKVHQA